MTDEPSIKVGQAVCLLDEVGTEHVGLVTAVHGPSATSALNVLYITDDPTKRDPYGQQVERLSSISHRDNAGGAAGRYWFL